MDLTACQVVIGQCQELEDSFLFLEWFAVTSPRIRNGVSLPNTLALKERGANYGSSKHTYYGC